MPSIVTHYLFSEAIIQKTTPKIQKHLKNKQKTYHIFAQSFDNLFYYNLLTWKKGKQIRKLGTKYQQENCSEYFQNIIQNIKEQQLQENSEILSYLYGSLTHYILDRNCHPFIIYQAGWIDASNPNYKYRGNHEKIEVSIDAILYKEKRKSPLYKAKLSDTLLPKIKFSKTLKNLITQTYQQTFNQENMGSIYETSTNQGHYILKYFVTDRTGIKKIAYKIFDKIFTKNLTMYQYLSFHTTKPDINILNRNHEPWFHPTDNTLKYTTSFDDLLKKAEKETLEIFKETEKVLYNKITLNEYLKKLKNISYTTGMNWRKKTKMKYFKN